MTTPFDPTIWIEKKRIEKKILPDHSLGTSLDPTLRPIPALNLDSPSRPIFKETENFLNHLVLEQLKRPEDLLKLNPSRRESIGKFLAELNRLPEPEHPQEALKNFVRMDRSEVEHEALKQFFKQIALVQVAKGLLLKSWCKNKNAPLLKQDLKDLTAAIERELRPFIHLQTSTCQLIQRNFYSWYKLDQPSQDMLYTLLEQIEDLGAFREWLLFRATQLSAETLGERSRYSRTFYKNLWSSIQKHQLLSFRTKSLFGFSPTLRDGAFMENAPEGLEWIGFEPLSFELLFCEIRHLWDRPKSPPLWVKGSGLEMSMEQQSSLLLTHSGKQNVVQQMDLISSCEVALIAEENLIRTQSRSLVAQALRKVVDQHSILKKLKQPATTRGMYQACQTLEKLRQQGILIWAREELLTETSGKPCLQFILNQAKLLLIADFTHLECAHADLKQDLPKSLYIFQKEINLEPRKSHRPLMVKVYGDMKNESEIAALMDRVISLVRNPEQVFPLEPFQINARVSPVDQREWEHHWFNPADDQWVDQIEDLKRNGTPLGQLAAIRAVTQPLIELSQNKDDLFSTSRLETQKNATGFFTWMESHKHGNEIFTSSFDHLPESAKNHHHLFWINPFRPEWIYPLQILMKSQLTRDWFNYSAERRKGAWFIKENDIKSIPVPRHISHALETYTEQDYYKNPVLQVIQSNPGSALKAIESENSENKAPSIHLKGLAFVTATKILENLEAHQRTLFSLFSPDDQLLSQNFIKTMIPSDDCVRLDKHALIRFTPTLGPRMPIHQITLVKFPSPGILLATHKGLHQQLFIQDAWLRERCFEAIQEMTQKMTDPTWEELCQQIRLPKDPTQSQELAHRLVLAYSEEKMKRKELNHLIGACLLNSGASQPKVGLLQ